MRLISLGETQMVRFKLSLLTLFLVPMSVSAQEKNVPKGVEVAAAFHVQPHGSRGPSDKKMVACTRYYSDCLSRATDYCQNQVLNIPTVQRATAYVSCLGQYQAVCRSSHCD